MRIQELNLSVDRWGRWLKCWSRGGVQAVPVAALRVAAFSGVVAGLTLSNPALSQEERPIRLCNHNDEGVYVAVAYEPTAGGPLMSRGWWTIESQGCVDLKFPIATDKILLHGESVSHAHQWQGEQSLCVDGVNKFDFVDAATRPCENNGLSKRLFKQLSLAELTASAAGGTPQYSFEATDAVNLGPVLRVCNDTSNDVYLSYAQRKAGNPEFNVGGWFKIAAAKCYEALRLPDTNELLLYANGNDDRQVWIGNVAVCTNHYDGFNYSASETANCDAPNQRRQLFRSISLEGYTDFEYRLRPQDAVSPRSYVSFCNNSTDKMDLAIVYKTLEIPDQIISQGWLTIDAQSCAKPMAINAESVYVYAENEGYEAMVEGTFAACIDWSEGFQFAKSTTMSCTGGTLSLAKFLEKPLQPGFSSVNLP
jgi:uncharacterized membrane protein